MTKLKNIAKQNTQVTRGTSKEQEVLKEGIPNDHSSKHLRGSDHMVGVSVGCTKNMDNYESLRVDVWLTDSVKDGETTEQAYSRIIGVVDETLHEIVQSYM